MKKSTLLIISVSLFGASLVTLVVSMIYHAAYGDETALVPAVALVSAVVSVAGIVFACLANKKGE